MGNAKSRSAPRLDLTKLTHADLGLPPGDASDGPTCGDLNDTPMMAAGSGNFASHHAFCTNFRHGPDRCVMAPGDQGNLRCEAWSLAYPAARNGGRSQEGGVNLDQARHRSRRRTELPVIVTTAQKRPFGAPDLVTF